MAECHFCGHSRFAYRRHGDVFAQRETGMVSLAECILVLCCRHDRGVFFEADLMFKVWKMVLGEVLHLNQPSNTVVYEELRPLLQHVKQQSRQIDDQVAELRERQREFTAMTEHMREGLVVISDQGYILSINACAMRILGLQDGIQYEKQHILMAKQNPELQTLVDEGLEGHHRDRILAIDGRMYQIVTNPIGPAGQMQGVVLLLLDVTEKQQQD